MIATRLEHELPPAPDHSCGGPNSACDSSCADFAYASEFLRHVDAILADDDSKGAGKEWTVKARAIEAWCQWYSKRLNSGEPQHSGYEQDLFEAFGCVAAVDARRGGV
jgi:hypothetical protein